MNVTKCENGHFYNQDKYDHCPHCMAGEMKTLSLDGLGYDSEKTVPLDTLRRTSPPSVLPREDYLWRKGLIHCIDRDYTITVIIVTESGGFEKSVQLPVKGGDNSVDVLRKLMKIGEISYDYEYSFSFANWPEVGPEWGWVPPHHKPSAFVCEICEKCKPKRFVALLKRVRRREIVFLYGCPNAASIDYSSLRERLSVEIIEYEN